MSSPFCSLLKPSAALLAGALLGAAVATPALAQEEKLRWKVQAVFGTHLPALGDPINMVAEALAEASDKDVQLKVFEPGEIVPPFEITEAVKNKQIPAGYNWLGYDQGKIPAAALFSALPFGMDAVAFAAWWYEGGGQALAEKVYAPHNVHPILCSVIGPETAGWFREEINTPADLQGKKIRFPGLGGKVLQKLGASVTVIPSGEIFAALEKGAIDGTEFSMPAIDEILGFDKVAKHNYFPGWHQPFTASHLVVNTEVWSSLTPAHQALINTTCTAGTLRALTRGEALQGSVLASYDKKGVTAHKLSPELLAALKKATDEVMAEASAADPQFKEVYESMQRFQSDYGRWKELAYLPIGI